MAVAKKKIANKPAQPKVLHEAFQPGEDGHTYLYHWVKFEGTPPPAKAGTPAARVLKPDTTVSIVDHDYLREGPFRCLSYEIKAPKAARSEGQFSMHWLPPGTSRKQAEAWGKSREGKEWAGDEPIAMGSIAMRMF
jgi:hypothetical protein